MMKHESAAKNHIFLIFIFRKKTTNENLFLDFIHFTSGLKFSLSGATKWLIKIIKLLGIRGKENVLCCPYSKMKI